MGKEFIKDLVFIDMMKSELILSEKEIRNRIYTVRGLQVMLDEDLAELYHVKTKRLNEQVTRNKERFPDGFMFQLDEEDYSLLKSQFATSNEKFLRSQFATLEKGRGKHRKYLPYVFTEQGVAMLSGVLKSDVAINVSISIINAFVNMRRFIASNAQIFQRLDSVEKKQIEYDKKFEEVFNAIETKGITPEKGIFFDGQVFDAYSFVSDLIRSAKSEIILIDNYIDDSVLTLFIKRNINVSVTILTKEITKQLSLDIIKYNSQYSPIMVKEFRYSHDRFLIIDGKEVYHFGASLKDLGKKWFAFSKFDKEAFKLLDRIKEV